MDLRTSDGEFKIDDTNTILHYTALIDDQPQTFPASDQLYFQIKNDKGFIQSAKGTATGTQVTMNSKDLRSLPAGSYQLELWHMTSDGTTDIFPADGFLPFKITENAFGTVGQSIHQVAFNHMSESLTTQFDDLKRQLEKKIDQNMPKQGASASVTISDIKLLPAGAQPYVKNLGTSLAAVLEFGIPTPGMTAETLTSSNLDEVRRGGFYVGNSSTISNAPFQGSFIAKVVGNNDNAVQTCYDLKNNESYTRTYTDGSWTSWRWKTQWN